MQRRKFMQQSLLAGGALVTASGAFAKTGTKDMPDDNQPLHLPYAIHDGMFNNLAGNDFASQIQFAYSMGFRAMEDNGMMSRTPDDRKKSVT